MGVMKEGLAFGAGAAVARMAVDSVIGGVMGGDSGDLLGDDGFDDGDGGESSI